MILIDRNDFHSLPTVDYFIKVFLIDKYEIKWKKKKIKNDMIN